MNKAKYLKAENKKWPVVLNEIPFEEWPQNCLSREKMPVQVWRSSGFLVQVYMDKGFKRISAMRTEFAPNGRMREGITWEELMRLKAQCGYGDAWAVEVFPPDEAVVNVQNMRHLFILPEAPPYGWNNNATKGSE